jgi:hypothetical protein
MHGVPPTLYEMQAGKQVSLREVKKVKYFEGRGTKLNIYCIMLNFGVNVGRGASGSQKAP